MRISGHYQMVVRRADGTVKEERSFDNMILDSGLKFLAVGWSVDEQCKTCHVGLGNTPVSPEQVGLAAWQANTQDNGPGAMGFIAVPGENAYMERTYVKRFAIGQAAGNLAEVGFGNGWGSAVLFSRALIRDAQGNPTTLTVLLNESLDVIYKVRIYMPNAATESDVVVGGVSYRMRVFCRRTGSGDMNNGWFDRQWVTEGGTMTAWEARYYKTLTKPGGPTVWPEGNFTLASSWALWDRTVLPGDNSTSRTKSITSHTFWAQHGTLASTDVMWSTGSFPVITIQFTPPLPIEATQRVGFDVKVTFARYAP